MRILVTGSREWNDKGLIFTELLMPKVLNKHHGYPPRDAVYIGRPSPWGNPFQMGKDGTREEVIAKFREFVEARPDFKASIRENLRGKDLVCFCAPLACHGDILLEIANVSDS